MGIRAQLAQIFRSPSSRDREERMTAQEQRRATSPAEQDTQRETERLAGMSADDQAWEQAALQRHRDATDRAS